MAELFLKTIGHDDNKESPRSCANTTVFQDRLSSSHYYNTSYGRNDTNVDHELEAAKITRRSWDCVPQTVSHEEEEGDDTTRMLMDKNEEESPAQVALLLTSVADIATKEIKDDPPIMIALADAFPCFSDRTGTSVDNGHTYYHHCHETKDRRQGILTKNMPSSSLLSYMHIPDQDGHKTRSVSMDSPEQYLRATTNKMQWNVSPSPPSIPNQADADASYRNDCISTSPPLLQWRDLRGKSTSPPHYLQHGIFSTPPPSPPYLSSKHNILVDDLHPMTTPPPLPNDILKPQHSCLRSFRSPRSLPNYHHHHHPNRRPRSISLAEATILKHHVPDLNDDFIETIHDCPTKGSNPTKDGLGKEVVVSSSPKEVILRKKFSWKNYPQLEEFLIANREEYLRHSTLNYTLQQKKYNNCLTHRMIQLASDQGYIFDETDFNFVTVRDRIRCYYKSYVQSMKKRGVVIGYAARKAGLLTEEELRESAHTSGKIYVPKKD